MNIDNDNDNENDDDEEEEGGYRKGVHFFSFQFSFFQGWNQEIKSWLQNSC